MSALDEGDDDFERALDAAADAELLSGATLKRTDLAAAERLVAERGDDLRFVGAWKKWLAWDGARWKLDDENGAALCAIETAKVVAEEALAACDSVNRRIAASGKSDALDEEKKEADRNLAWAASLQSASKVRATLTLAAALPALAVSHANLDADPWVLNVPNGTIDLRTAELRPHRREDLITQLAPVAYDPDAKCPTWDAFLERAMGGDGHMLAYLQRLVGYTITGSTREHVLAFCYGEGANGKSTFLNTLHSMLGDYATPARRKLLFARRNEGHATEIATLFRKRFVTCSEIAQGQAFDEELTKDLTGGDPLNCRRMCEDEWRFDPTHTIFVAGNHRPIVRGDDEGIWRRIRLIPWTVTIPAEERDKALPERLRAELPGILAWAVRGALEWQRVGLGDPPAVADATAAYRESQDVLGQYFAERTRLDPAARMTRKALREDYEAWCRDVGHEPLGARRLSEALTSRGVRPCNVREGMRFANGWAGVRLATDADKVGA